MRLTICVQSDLVLAAAGENIAEGNYRLQQGSRLLWLLWVIEDGRSEGTDMVFLTVPKNCSATYVQPSPKPCRVPLKGLAAFKTLHSEPSTPRT